MSSGGSAGACGWYVCVCVRACACACVCAMHVFLFISRGEMGHVHVLLTFSHVFAIIAPNASMRTYKHHVHVLFYI
jgi:hypothetical protein